VSFVVMYVLYHQITTMQAFCKLFSRCLPYEYFGSQTGGGYQTRNFTHIVAPTHTRPIQRKFQNTQGAIPSTNRKNLTPNRPHRPQAPQPPKNPHLPHRHPP